MQHDSHGLALSTDPAAAARAFDHPVAGYIGYRADAGQGLAPLLRGIRTSRWRIVSRVI